MSLRGRIAGLLWACLCLAPGWAGGANVRYELDRERSVLAIVTQAAGLAAGFAHNHLIDAGDYQGELAVDPADLNASSVRIVVPVRRLEVDRPRRIDRALPELRAMHILEKGFGEPAGSDLRAMRKNMFSSGQLDAESFPLVTAELRGLRAERIQIGERVFTRAAELRLTVRGHTVSRRVAVDARLSDGRLEAQAIGSFSFTEFGIEPFSAFLGLIRNRNQFHVYVDLVAVPAGPVR